MNFSIQRIYQRLVAILCVGLSILLLVEIVVFSFLQLRYDYARELTAQATMVANGIEEKGFAAAGEKLQLVRNNPQLLIACVLGEEGQPLDVLKGAAHGTVIAGVNMPASPLQQCVALSKEKSLGHEVISGRAPIQAAGLPRAVGEVYMVAITPGIWEHFGLRLFIFFATIGVFVLLFGWLGFHLRRAILRPIHQIATTAQRVSMYKDYSLRVDGKSMASMPKEILLLIDSFNAMLKEIEDRDSRLTRKTEELEKSREKAEAANIAKSQFLASVSHELRTPLNAIIGFSTMLTQQPFGPIGNEKYAGYAQDIHDSGKHLLDVINDILDLSQADSGAMAMKFESLSLPKIIEKCINIVAGQAQENRIDIYTDMPEKLPRITADRVRLMQVFLNLLSNAVKYTPAGGQVTVRVRVEMGQNHVHFFTVEVEDNGIGMSAEEIARAFTSFNQAEAGLNRKYGGAGLGLPLTKKLVELHHGRIKVESELGKGTTVSVRLTSDPALLD